MCLEDELLFLRAKGWFSLLLEWKNRGEPESKRLNESLVVDLRVYERGRWREALLGRKGRYLEDSGVPVVEFLKELLKEKRGVCCLCCFVFCITTIILLLSTID